MMRFLRVRLAGHGVDMCLSDEVGLPAAYKEAIKFAMLRWGLRRREALRITSLRRVVLRGFLCWGWGS